MFALLFLLAAPSLLVTAYEDTCSPFNEIYSNGTELCEVMWGGAFKVVDDAEPSYTMWFFDHENNPNDATTRALFGEEKVADQCHLEYYHKSGPPTPEGDGMAECHPWKNNACCTKDTVGSVDQINEAYGEGYEWDRCGKMSQACERFFVMEACLYECEPAAGLFRKYNDSEKGVNDDFNAWQMHQMPIKKSFCNAWYDACYNDYFCGKGDYFECQEHYKKNKKAEEDKLVEEKKAAEDALIEAEKALKASKKEDGETNDNLTIGLAVAGAVAGIGIFVALFLAFKESKGEAVFAPVKSEIA